MVPIFLGVLPVSMPVVFGNATTHAKAGLSDKVITTASRQAGAIHSLKWNGQEFIDSADYGRWRFPAEEVVKWNAVYRLHAQDGVPPGEYAFRLFVAVGTRENVRETLEQLFSLQK